MPASPIDEPQVPVTEPTSKSKVEVRCDRHSMPLIQALSRLRQLDLLEMMCFNFMFKLSIAIVQNLAKFTK